MISYLNFRSGALSALTLLKKQPLFKSKQDQEEWILKEYKRHLRKEELKINRH